MVKAPFHEHLFAQLLEERDGLGKPSGKPVSIGQIVQRMQGTPMIRAELREESESDPLEMA